MPTGETTTEDSDHLSFPTAAVATVKLFGSQQVLVLLLLLLQKVEPLAAETHNCDQKRQLPMQTATANNAPES